MQIHQFQVSYLAEQDRILVRMNATDGQEQRLWLTRRLLLSLYPHLEKMAARLTLADAPPVAHDGAADAAIQTFQRQETLDRTDFDTPYQSPQPVFGEDDQPLLVTTAHLQKQDSSTLSVRFEESLPGLQESRQLEIHMGSDTLIALLHVISLSLQHSDWGLNPVTPLPAAALQPGVIESNTQDAAWEAFATAERPEYLN
jgi:hypothetical protein